MQTKLGLKIWTIKYKQDCVGPRRQGLWNPRGRCQYLGNKMRGRKEEVMYFSFLKWAERSK